MGNYVIKFVCGSQFMDGLDDEKTRVDRIVHIDGLDLEEFESMIEMLAMKVFKKRLFDAKNNKESISSPIVNCYIYDGMGNFITGKEVNILGEEIKTVKYTKEMIDVLKQFKK